MNLYRINQKKSLKNNKINPNSLMNLLNIIKVYWYDIIVLLLRISGAEKNVCNKRSVRRPLLK